MKIDLLIQYLNEKIGFRKMNLRLPQKLTLKSENALLLTTRNQVVLQGKNKCF